MKSFLKKMVAVPLLLLGLQAFSTDVTPPPPVATWKSNVATVGALPATGNTQGDTRVVLSNSFIYVWTGSTWQLTGGGGGLNGIGAIDSQAKTSNGAALFSNTLYFQTADASYPGLVSNSTQEFSGDKTFDGNTYFKGATANNIASIENYSLNLFNGNYVNFYDNTNTNYIGIFAPASVSAQYDLSLPQTQGPPNSVFKNNGSGALSWDTPIFTSGGTMVGELVLNPATQLNPNDGATIGQLLSYVSGAAWKPTPADVATTANITLSGEQTIDGFTTSSSRVLVKNQTTTTQNGIYVSSSGAWSRSSDANTSSELNAAAISVVNGTTQHGSSWTQTTPNPVIGTDAIAWGPLGITYAGGTAIDLTANAFSVKYDNSTIKVNGSNQLYVPAGAAGIGTINAPNGATSSGNSTVNFLTGTAGSDFAIVESAGNTITWNLPVASATSSGKVSTGTQTFGGAKSFSSSITLTNTTGTGFLNLPQSTVVPVTPTSSISLYSDTNNNLEYKLPSGIHWTFDSSSLTGNRVFSLPDTTDQVTTNGYIQTLTNKTITSTTNTLGGVTMGLGSDNLGDMYYANAFNHLTRLAGNSTSTNKFLTMQGTGANPNPPAWATISTADIPTSGVTAGSYTTANITVNAQGQVTAAANGAPNIASTSLFYEDWVRNTSTATTLLTPLAGSSGAGTLTYVTPTGALSWRPGIVQLTSGLIAGNRQGVGISVNAPYGENTATFTVEEDVAFPTLSNGTNNFYFRSGAATTNYSIGSSTSEQSFIYDADTIVVTGTLTNGISTVSSVTQKTVAITGNITNGSNQILLASSTTGYVVGAAITGTGIPAATFINAISGTTITMSANATATTVGLAITVTNQTPLLVFPGATVTGTGIPGGTTISSISTAGVWTLSNSATTSGAQALTIVNSGTWKVLSGLSTKYDTGVNIAANTWYKLTTVINPLNTSTQYYVNGTLVYTATTGLSAGLVNVNPMLHNSSGTGGAVDFDYVSFLTQMVVGR